MGRKCSVESCQSEANRVQDEGVTFHKVPLHPDIRPKWFSLCRITGDKKSLKVIYVCSRHFLRADFCDYRGKKFMLRQGVLPSVFPWDKSKLEAMKNNSKKDTSVTDVKIKEEPPELVKEEPLEVKQEPMDTTEDLKPPDIVQEPANIPQQSEINQETDDINKKDLEKTKNTGSIVYAINSKLEALDFNNVWYPAKVVEVDYEENEVLIHFDKFSSKYDEWICMDSPRLRPPQPPKPPDEFQVGDKCMAAWSDSRKFAATVTKIISKDTYEVLFDDGFVKIVKGHKMSKAPSRPAQSSPLFEPIQSSKQERRDKKRKINVAALFCSKKPRVSSGEETEVPIKQEDDLIWMPIWENGRPIGTESIIETNDGPKASTIVADPRLPQGWIKHLVQRTHGSSAGKWDTIIVGQDNRRFRTKSEIKIYLENHPELELNEAMFDFSLHKTKKKTVERKPPVLVPQVESVEEPEEPIKEENPNALKIIFENDAYKCPIEGCGKNFRKENLAQMHVKHYHKEFAKCLDSTPNVADLAYARTVGENLDKSPGPSKQPFRAATKTSTPKLGKAPILDSELKSHSPIPSNKKDAEIIKLLSTKPYDNSGKKEDSIQPLPSGLPSSMYPDIKLRDLLSKSEAVPKRDELNLKSLCSSRPPIGIKTLLPVRPSLDGQLRRNLEDFNKGNDILSTSTPTLQHSPTLSTTQPANNNIIIEGGEIIKIVRMKQEEIINCTCGFTEEDGLMIQCELCLCWQHAYCNNIERESQVPEKYVCFICQHPLRERASQKFMHDQDWLKQGTLPMGSFHTTDKEAVQRRFDELKKLHDLSGGLQELKNYHNSLAVKLKIAEVKNHPKLYLWSKPWDKPQLPEKLVEQDPECKIKQENDDHQYIKNEPDEKPDSMLMMILKGGKDEQPEPDSAPIIPKPVAAIKSSDCCINLMEHIKHAELLIEERLDDFERQIEALENSLGVESDVKTRQTLQMLTRDLGVLSEFSQITTI